MSSWSSSLSRFHSKILSPKRLRRAIAEMNSKCIERPRVKDGKDSYVRNREGGQDGSEEGNPSDPMYEIVR